ncbi:SpoIID/LytB domain-containing protein [Endomicrobium proavitum]|uniref:Stage II sporulation-related protein n=1 Tax=Endomicrobium proavitum TaxID=1408281 RepID=A0A0G3WHW2_9BACT|nr:SpoIID/LytB domain-containing protein [Endomicrobium proavitum]AKL97933.1 Stage II sporulation-related protein [Endomicrobium proavitum]
MIKKIFLLLLPIFAVLFSSCLSTQVKQSNISFSSEVENKYVRIGIVLNTAYFTVSSAKTISVTDASGKKLTLSKGNVKFSYYSNGKLGFNDESLSFPVKIESANNVIYVNKKAYRGSLVINKDGDSVNVINVLPVEDYIKGVLPKEANAGWHAEALKTQAVISRTYTLANLGKHKDKGFDMCSTTHCQVYAGAEVETAATNKAVSQTEGQVLTYNGKFANTFFHANCGGHTEDPKYVWDTKDTPEYLKGVKCGYCKNAPHSSWEQSLDESFIRSKLSAAGFNVGIIKSIKVKGETPAGSAKEIVINGSKNTVTINAYKFRLAVDAWKIKSVTFDGIKKSDDNFIFKGHGWGHKVGLCQWGAKGMAESGKNYQKILKHFYPGTKLEKVQYK